jgi:hypothetical protein
MDGWVDKTNQVEHILRGGRMSLYAFTIYIGIIIFISTLDYCVFLICQKPLTEHNVT